MFERGEGKWIGLLRPGDVASIQQAIRSDLYLEAALRLNLGVNLIQCLLHKIRGRHLVLLNGHSMVHDQARLSGDALALSPGRLLLPD